MDGIDVDLVEKHNRSKILSNFWVAVATGVYLTRLLIASLSVKADYYTWDTVAGFDHAMDNTGARSTLAAKELERIHKALFSGKRIYDP